MTIMVHNNYWETVRMDFENALSRTWSDIELDMFTSRLKTIESFHSSRFLKTSEPSTTQLPTGLFKVAQLVVNRIQKLRKKASLEPADVVEVYIKPSSDEDATTLKQAMSSEEQCIREAIGSPLLLADLMPSSAVILSEETFAGVFNVSFTISLTRPTLVFDDEALLRLYEGNANFQQGLMDYLRSRDPNKLKAEFHAGNGKIRVDCIKDQPPVDVVLGHHVFLSVGDHYLSTKSG